MSNADFDVVTGPPAAPRRQPEERRWQPPDEAPRPVEDSAPPRPDVEPG
jgi:hypothetical protein